MPSSRYLQSLELAAIAALPTTIHIYTTDPTSSDVGTEVSGGGYLPQPITFGAPAVVGLGTEITNTGVVTFPIASADWSAGAPATHFAIRDGVNMIHYGTLTSLGVPVGRTVRSGDTLQIPIGICKIRKPD